MWGCRKGRASKVYRLHRFVKAFGGILRNPFAYFGDTQKLGLALTLGIHGKLSGTVGVTLGKALHSVKTSLAGFVKLPLTIVLAGCEKHVNVFLYAACTLSKQNGIVHRHM